MTQVRRETTREMSQNNPVKIVEIGFYISPAEKSHLFFDSLYCRPANENDPLVRSLPLAPARMLGQRIHPLDNFFAGPQQVPGLGQYLGILL